MSFIGSVLGDVGNVATLGLYGGAKKLVNSATTNSFQANPYGMTQPTTTQAPPTWKPAFPGDTMTGTWVPGAVTTTPGGVDPSVAAAFNYQDPNAPDYTTNAQQQQQQQQQVYGQQQGLDSQLQQSASGNGPSIAQNELTAALGQSNAQANSIAQNAIANGVNPALAYNEAQNSAAQNTQTASNNAAIQKVNEELSARQQLAGTLSDQSGAASQNALSYYGMGQQGQQFGSTAQQSEQQLLEDAYNQAQGINSGVAASNTTARTALLGAGLSAIGSAGASALKSDERAKEAVDRDGADHDIDGFINALDTASWRYKKGVGEDDKRHWGVMAQSLAKTDVGRSMLLEDEQGFLNIDTRQGFGAVLAAQKRLADRIADLERVRAS